MTKLVVAWPDWTTRVDRCLMFSETGQWLQTVYLLTAKPLPPQIAGRLHSNVQVIELGNRLKGFSFRQASRAVAAKIISDARAGDKIILHDLAVARLLPKSAHTLTKKTDVVRGVLSLYSPTYTNFKSRAWRQNRSQYLPFWQEYVYWKSVLTKIPMEYYSCRVADIVTGNSQQICNDVIGAYGKSAKQVSYVPAEVDLEFFYCNQRTESDFPRVLFCGRLYTRKGVFDLLDATYQLFQEGLHFQVLLVGENNLESDRIQQAVKEYGISDIVSILPLQPRDRIRELMQSSSIFVLPTYFEGSPRVVKEAMASGCPVVTYDIPGTRLLDPTGKSLRLVPLGDTTKLAGTMRELLENPDKRKVLGLAGQKRMQENFGLKAVAQQMVALYQRAFE